MPQEFSIASLYEGLVIKWVNSLKTPVWRRRRWLPFYRILTNCAIVFFVLFVTYFVHNVSASVSNDRKDLLDLRSAITHLVLDKDYLVNESDAKDLLQTPDKAQIPVIRMKKRQRYRGHRSGCLVRIRVGNPPLPSVLLANVQSLDNKMDELRSKLYLQQDIKNYNILCFTESWLNVNIDNIQLAGFSVHRQDRTAASRMTRGGGLCLFVNNSWCTKSNIKEVSRFCSPVVEYLMITCRPHDLQREFIYIFLSCLFTTTNLCWH